MKQLKFRVWLPDYQQMIYPHLDDFIRDKEGMVIGKLNIGLKYNFGLEFDMIKAIPPFYKDQMGEIDEESYEVNHVIQQFTGLKDVSFQEIYEGDLIDGKFWINDLNEKIKSGFTEITSREVFLTSGEFRCKPTERLSQIYKPKIVGNIFANLQLISPKT